MWRRFPIALVLLGVLGATSASGAAASGWSIQRTPNPTGAPFSYLKGVSCTSKSACTAVGYYNDGTGTYVALAERWNGATWSIQSLPNPVGATDSFLSGVSCTSGSVCTAVGYYKSGTTSVTLAERWNGTKWTIKPTPNPSGTTDSELYGVSCTSGSACTAVGYYKSGAAYVTLAERWNGTKWTIKPTPNPSAAKESYLNGVSCTSGSACTAVGFHKSGAAYVTLAERWNGTKWSIPHTLNPTGSPDSELNNVSCASQSACTAVGYYIKGTGGFVALVERWNGTKWTIQKVPNPTGGKSRYLSGVSCTSVSVCTGVGYYSNGTAEVALVERWNGTNWWIQHTPNPSATNSYLDGVSCTSQSACIGVGDHKSGTAYVTLAERWSG